MNRARARLAATRVPFLVPAYGAMREAGSTVRAAYLRRRHPDGALVRCEGVAVHCDFRDPSHRWYAKRSPNLAFDLRLLDELLHQASGNVFFDIGAHWGFFTAALAQRVAPASRIVAVEADPAHVRNLERTVREIAAPEVLIERVAVADRAGEITLFGGDGDCAHVFAMRGQVPVATVRAVRFDDLVDEHCTNGRSLAFVKVDIDGAEPGFLAGAEEALDHHRPIVFMEYAPTYLAAFGSDPVAFLDDLADRFVVHWVSYVTHDVTRVRPGGAHDIARMTGDGISDLVLTSDRITLPDGMRVR